MRSHLKDCLEQQIFRPFPTVDIEKCNHLLTGSFSISETVQIKCICRMPNFMKGEPIARCVDKDCSIKVYHRSCTDQRQQRGIWQQPIVNNWTCSICIQGTRRSEMLVLNFKRSDFTLQRYVLMVVIQFISVKI
jgi:hypothetical protein